VTELVDSIFILLLRVSRNEASDKRYWGPKPSQANIHIRTSVNPPAASIALLPKRSGFFCMPYVIEKFRK